LTRMNTEPNSKDWYALQVRTRWESSTSSLLSGKGYETFLPTFETTKRWNGRLQETSAALFPGYVFCRFDVHNRLPILITPGVIAVVGIARVPVPVKESEILAIQRMVASGLRTEPWPYLEVGQRIRIEDGALSGLEGILTSLKGHDRIVVSVSLLCRSVALDIQRCSVRPIPSGRIDALRSLAAPVLADGVLA
jgi:transcription antitermination factor NusG